MLFDFTDLAFMTGVVVGLSEFLKLIKVKASLIPIINMTAGLLLGFYYVSPEDPKQALMAGFIIGLSANGLYSGIEYNKKATPEPAELKEKYEEINNEKG